jgi:hypothetical protein
VQQVSEEHWVVLLLLVQLQIKQSLLLDKLLFLTDCLLMVLEIKK